MQAELDYILFITKLNSFLAHSFSISLITVENVSTMINVPHYWYNYESE